MEDGATFKEHLMAGWRQKNYAEQYKPEKLIYPEAPVETKRVWDYFQELHDRREWGDTGPRLIGWRDIEAWKHIRNRNIEAWEIDAILKLDSAFVTVYFEKNK